MDLTKIAEWLKLSTQHLFALFLFSVTVFAVLIFASDNILETIGLRDFRADYRSWLGLGLIFSFAGLLARMISWLVAWSKEQIRARRLLKRRHQRLRNLRSDEYATLRPYIEEGVRTQYFRIHNGVVHSLEAQTIIGRAASISNENGAFAYNIQPWAWDYLNEHPELVDLSA